MGRNYLAGQQGDAANAVLAAAGYNFRKLLAWLELGLSAFLFAMARPAASRHQPVVARSVFFTDDCNEVMAAKRLDQAMSFIEHERKFACEKAARRTWVDVEPHKLVSYR